MRTLKKTLCFVLAVVMVLGIGAFSVFAESTTGTLSTADVSEEYKTAAKVTAALSIFNGGTGDTWTSSLNRAQAATILTRLRGVDASTLTATSNSFTDLDPWAEPYVAYAERAGLILGVGEGRFAPQESLTGYQWALMLLRVLGYVDKSEGVTYDNWQVVTARLARQTKIDEGITDMSVALTREQAAQMVFNALKADMVEYGTGVSVTTTDGTGINVSGGRKLQTTTANWGAAIGDKRDNNAYVIQLGEQLYQGKLQLSDDQFDDFGRPNCDTWKLNGKDIVKLASKTDNLVTTYTGKVEYQDIYKDLGSGVVKSDTIYLAFVDGKSVNTFDASKLTKSNDDKVLDTGKSVTTELYREYDADLRIYTVTVVVINSYVAQATSDYNSSKETLSISADSQPGALETSNLDADEISGLDQFMSKDWLVYTAAWNGKKYDVKTVTAPTKLEGVTVTAYGLTSDGARDTVTADGTKYSYNKNASDDATFKTLCTSYETTGDSTYDIYVDQFNNVIFAEGHTGSGRYVYVLNTYLNKTLSTRVEARIVNVEGKESDVVVSKYNRGDPYNFTKTAASFDAGNWYRYTMDDTKYRLFPVTNYNETTLKFTKNVTFNKGQGAVTADSGVRILLNSATTFVVDDGNSYRVYNGVSKIPTIINAKGAAVVKSNGYANYVYISAKSSNISDSTNLSWAFIRSGSYTTGYDSANKADTYTYNAIVNGEDTTIVLNDLVAGPGLYFWYTTKYDRPDNVLSYDRYAGYEYRFDSSKSSGLVSVSTDGDTLSFNGEAWVIASDAKIWTVPAGGGDAKSYSLRGAVVNEFNEKFNGTIYVVSRSDSDETKTEVYFLGDGASDTTSTVDVENYAISVNNTEFAVKAYGETPSDSDVIEQIKAYLYNEGYLTVNTSYSTVDKKWTIRATNLGGTDEFTWTNTDIEEAIKISINGKNMLVSKETGDEDTTIQDAYDEYYGTLTSTQKNAEKEFDYALVSGLKEPTAKDAESPNGFKDADTTPIQDGGVYETGYVQLGKISIVDNAEDGEGNHFFYKDARDNYVVEYLDNTTGKAIPNAKGEEANLLDEAGYILAGHKLKVLIYADEYNMFAVDEDGNYVESEATAHATLTATIGGTHGEIEDDDKPLYVPTGTIEDASELLTREPQAAADGTLTFTFQNTDNVATDRGDEITLISGQLDQKVDDGAFVITFTPIA